MPLRPPPTSQGGTCLDYKSVFALACASRALIQGEAVSQRASLGKRVLGQAWVCEAEGQTSDHSEH